jgi:hypothetical protein
VIVAQVPAQVMSGREQLPAPPAGDNAHQLMVPSFPVSTPDLTGGTFGSCPYGFPVAADPSPPVSRDGHGSGEQQSGRRFERYVTRLPDGRRLTLYSRPARGPIVPVGRNNG